MNRRLVPVRAWLALLPLVVLCLPAPVAAGVEGEVVRYRVAVPDPATRLFRVTAEFADPGEELRASLPAWTPGAYEIEDYARNVRNFSATDADGRPLDWDKSDPDTWRVSTAGARVARLTYDVLADSLDLDKSRILDDFAFFNGTNLFVYQEDRTDRPAELVLDLPPGWKAATALTPTGDPFRFTAASFDQLVDAPTFLGHFQLDSFTAGGRPAQLAVYPANAFNEGQRQRLRDSIDRLLTVQNGIVGAAPYERYLTLFYIGIGTVYGGLEHAESHLDILPPAVSQSFDAALPGVLSLVAHETFHLWNVKRIRPAAMWPYDYDTWQPSELLWFSEGVTDYYGDLSMARAGLFSREQFLGQVENNLASVDGEPERRALEDTSLDTWVDPVLGNRYVYYPQGSLTGLMLDLRIRHATGNRHSLDDVVRRLYAERYARGEGFTTADVLGFVAEAGDPDVRSFYERYVDGRDDLPVRETLALAGLAVERSETSTPFLGVSTAADAQGRIVVGAVSSGSVAAQAGVKAGDVLLAVGDVEVGSDDGWGDRFTSQYANREGAALPLRVGRDGQDQVLTASVRLQRQVQYRVTPDPDAGELERRILESLVARE
jgi:predicted metalloprotease with PDZ domain